MQTHSWHLWSGTNRQLTINQSGANICVYTYITTHFPSLCGLKLTTGMPRLLDEKSKSFYSHGSI